LGVEHLTHWKPGQSGNPGGRVKADVIALARALTKDAVNTLASIMKNEDEPPTARISAANSILDRGWGKAVQTIATPDGDSPLTLHLIAAKLISEQDLAAEQTPAPRTINHEPNGKAFDLNAPPPLE
jgi:hypothetical protein